MARIKFKWKFAFLLYLVFLNVFTKSLPLTEKNHAPILTSTDSIIVEDNIYVNFEDHSINDVIQENVEIADATETHKVVEGTKRNFTDIRNQDVEQSLLRNIRPNQRVSRYSIEITPNGNSFRGTAMLNVDLDASTRLDPIRLHLEGLNIESVEYGLYTISNPQPCDFNVDDGELELTPERESSTYVFLIRYNGVIRNDGIGLYQGNYGENSYLAVNLHPTNARRVFPCMDEPSAESTIQFTFNGIEQTTMVGNSIIEASVNNQFIFTPMQGPVYRWGFVAHSFINANNPVIGTRLFMRPGLIGQDGQASVIINAIFSRMQDWTLKPYGEIQEGQNEVVDIIAMPDITKDWHALSSICVWEPYILMPVQHAATQRKTAMVEISKAIASQWFGYVIYPFNWRYSWINTGLSGYLGYEMARSFQGDADGTDNTIIDVNTAFVADVIQESLLRDGYSASNPLESDEDLFDQNLIRDRINGNIKLKAPAIMHMLKMALGQTDQDPGVDVLQAAARSMLNSVALQSFSSLNFYDAVHDVLPPNALIENVEVFLESWVGTSTYPIVNVQLWNAGVTLTQERFGFTNINQVIFPIPITYTTSLDPNFEDITPKSILDNTQLLTLSMDEEDWFLCNIQGQGYYRVNYDNNLWDRIINVLEDPDARNIIHPLNRATLVDDALNLARASRLPYDTAFRVVLTMEHETEYAVWRAYIRNMNFVKRRLEAFVMDDEDMDPNIYLRMIHRTIGAFEQQIGFSPDPLIIEDTMTSITRGQVMEHACSSGYQPCIAAAIDYFYDPGSPEPAVNPNIPHDIRPAVYCTMMREGDGAAREALLARYDAETSAYERLVIVRSLACSSDEDYLRGLLQEMIWTGGVYGVEERAEFFKALIESSVSNAKLALAFIRINTNGIRSMFGGDERLEEIIFLLADNMANEEMTDNIDIWITSTNSGLDASTETAERAAEYAKENMVWIQANLIPVYEWIDENDAQSIAVSMALMVFCFMFNIFNQ